MFKKIFGKKQKLTKEEQTVLEMKAIANAFIEKQMAELEALTDKMLEDNKKELEKALNMINM